MAPPPYELLAARAQVQVATEDEDEFAPSDVEDSEEEEDRFQGNLFVDEDGSGVLLTIFGQVYVAQGGALGFQSLHFEEAVSYISHESPQCSELWDLDDGSRPPSRKEFLDFSYESSTRTFQGEVNWAPTTWERAARWRYVMTFSEDLSSIESGKVDRFHPGGVLPFWTQVFGKDLHYTRWHPPEPELSKDLPVSQWEERLVPVNELRYSQSSCRCTFKDGTPILTLFTDIKNGEVEPKAFNFLVVKKRLQNSAETALFVTEGHRRLWVLKTLQWQRDQIIEVPVRIIPESQVGTILRERSRAGLSRKELRLLRDFTRRTLTTENEGLDIEVRFQGGPGASRRKRGRRSRR